MKNRPVMLVLGLLMILAAQLACALPLNNAAPKPTQTSASPFGKSTDNPGFCPANLATPVNSSMILSAVMAKNVEGENKNPVDPTSDPMLSTLLTNFPFWAAITYFPERALAFFGEKYGEQVKVYTIGDFSKEVCGGPHVNRTAELGCFKIIKQEAVGQGVRRIRAEVE